MSSKKRCLMVGAGGFARAWLTRFLPPFFDRIEFVGLVDINPEPLQVQGDFLNLPTERRFTDLETAFEKVEADFCIVVIPPAYHRIPVLMAAERGMDILSEKPVADTWEDCLEIYNGVKKAGVKMTVIQNYRYEPEMATLKSVVCGGDLGPVNFVTGRFAADYRKRGAWGMFRHEIPHSLLVEGGVHHLDQFRNLTGQDCDTIAGWEWNACPTSFDGECCATYVMTMSDGAHACYEGSCCAAGTQNSWHKECFRIECEDGAASLDRDRIVRVYRHTAGQGLKIHEVPPIQLQYESHQAVINNHLNWLDDGPAPETILDDNMKSVAMVFAAIEASETNSTVELRKYAV